MRKTQRDRHDWSGKKKKKKTAVQPYGSSYLKQEIC